MKMQCGMVTTRVNAGYLRHLTYAMSAQLASPPWEGPTLLI